MTTEPERSKVDKAISQVAAKDFDGRSFLGGCVGADKLRATKEVVSFVRDFFAQQKPVGVICYGPWTLIEADVVKGRTLTPFPTLQTDIENAGGIWVDQEVVTDKGLSRAATPTTFPPSAPRSSRNSPRASIPRRPAASSFRTR